MFSLLLLFIGKETTTTTSWGPEGKKLGQKGSSSSNSYSRNLRNKTNILQLLLWIWGLSLWARGRFAFKFRFLTAAVKCWKAAPIPAQKSKTSHTRKSRESRVGVESEPGPGCKSLGLLGPKAYRQNISIPPHIWAQTAGVKTIWVSYIFF